MATRSGSAGKRSSASAGNAAGPRTSKRTRNSAAHPAEIAEKAGTPAVLNRPVDVLQEKVLEHSSATFVLDTWPGFEAFPNAADGASPIFKLEAREGIGAAIQGYVSATGAAAGSSKPISVLATPASLLLIASTLSELSASSASVAVHVASNQTNAAQLFEALRALELGLPGFAQGEIVFSGGKGGREVISASSHALKSAAGGKVVINVFDDLEAGQEYAIYQDAAESDFQPFSYIGPKDAETVLVLPSSQHSASAAAALASMESPAAQKVGIVTVHSVTSEGIDGLASHIPSSATSVYAPTANSDVDESATWFYDLALSTIVGSGSSNATVLPLPLVATWTIREWAATIVRVASPSSSKAFSTPALKPLVPESSKLAAFWSSDVGPSAKVAPALAAAFASIAHATSGGVSPRLLETFDNFAGTKSASGLGVKSADLLLSPTDAAGDKDSSAAAAPLGAVALTSEPSFIFVSNPQFVLASYNAVERAGSATQVVFSGPWQADEYRDKLGKHEKERLLNAGGVFALNADAVVKDAGLSGEDAVAAVEQIAFWHFYSNSAEEHLAGLVQSSLAKEEVAKLLDATKAALVKIDLKPAVDAMEVDEEAKATPLQQLAPGEADATIIAHPAFIAVTKASSAPNAFKTNPEILPIAQNWHQAAKQLLYPEAYALPSAAAGDDKQSMRPDLAEDNYIITVSENRRLTPLDYDRNVFHMEFSTKGTGLKYSVGEALGIHGLNDTEEVLEFINWYGLNPDDVVTYPSRIDGRMEARTIFQLFQQSLDVFGKPPKSFYEALGKFTTLREEARQLRFISSAEGSSTFKKWAELDTVTYADVLKAFPSAKDNFGIQDLIREIAPIKPRHYSIASSQNAVGDSVHLLVVTVDWETPAGQKRYGQCTRYLAGLPVGAKVMVSVKPSVMKLPPRDSQPIIMAGLGTGAAPFRAFMQERAWQRAQGMDVGPLLYYFGARYRSAEYLYGEEIEAYVRDGVIGHTGLAFSRDTKAKVYIQHKMNQDGKLLANMLEDGVFYLCGPTWPVPDVYKALTDAITKNKGKSTKEAEEYIEELKEAERYVLEVY